MFPTVERSKGTYSKLCCSKILEVGDLRLTSNKSKNPLFEYQGSRESALHLPRYHFIWTISPPFYDSKYEALVVTRKPCAWIRKAGGDDRRFAHAQLVHLHHLLWQPRLPSASSPSTTTIYNFSIISLEDVRDKAILKFRQILPKRWFQRHLFPACWSLSCQILKPRAAHWYRPHCPTSSPSLPLLLLLLLLLLYRSYIQSLLAPQQQHHGAQEPRRPAWVDFIVNNPKKGPHPPQSLSNAPVWIFLPLSPTPPNARVMWCTQVRGYFS